MDIEKWWPELSESARAALASNPRGPLSAESIIAITGARGVGPVGTAWEGRSADFHLTETEIEWIEEHV